MLAFVVASRRHENVENKDKKLWTITYQFHKHPPTAPSLVEITMTISFIFLNAYYLLFVSNTQHHTSMMMNNLFGQTKHDVKVHD